MARRRIELEIVGDASQLGREFNKAARQAQLFNARITGTTRSLSRGLGFAGATAGIASLGLAIRSTVNAATSFESSFAGVRKTVNATEPQFRELAEGFRALSREIPVSVDELNQIGEAAGQLGVRRDAILDFTRTVADLGVTTDLTSDQAADALARLANIAGTPQDEFDRLGSTVVELGNKLAATESEIIDFSLRIAGAGRQVNLTEADILAISGAFASVGVEAERGGTAVSKVLLAMNSAVLDGTDNLKRFADVAGQSVSDFRQGFEQDAGQAFARFVEGLDSIRRSGGNTFQTLRDLGLTDSRLISAFQAMAAGSSLLTRSLTVGERAWERNNALTKEAEKRYATTASRFQIFENRVHDLQISLGSALLPTLEAITEPLSDWLADTENQERITRELTNALDQSRSAIEGISRVIGPLVDDVRGATDAVGGMRKAIELLLVTMAVGKIVGFTGAITGLGGAAAGSAVQANVLRTALLRLGAIGVITLGVEVLLNKEQISDTVDDFLRRNRAGFLTGEKIEIPVDADTGALQRVRNRLAGIKGESDLMVKALDKAIGKLREFNAEQSKRPDDSGEARGPGAISAENARPKPGPTTPKTRRDVVNARVSDADDMETQAEKAEKAKERAQTAFEKLMASFDLDLSRAEASGSINRQIAVLEDQQDAIRRRMAVVGRTVELQQEELRVEQQIAQLERDRAERRRDRRQANQFEALGLTAEGEEKVPGVGALAKKAKSIKAALKGTVLDTAKTRKELANITNVLDGDFGAVGRTVRAQILQMLNDLGAELGQAGGTGKLTKRRITSAEKSGNVSAFGFNIGTASAVSNVAPLPAQHIHLIVDGTEIADFVIDAAQRRNQRSVTSRGGRHGGTKLF